MGVNFYVATVTTDASGDGTNLNALGNPVWNGNFEGKLRGVRFENAAYDATADITLAEPNGLKRTIDSLGDSQTPTNHIPYEEPTGSTDFFVPFCVNSNNLKVTVAQGGNAKTGSVVVLIED